MRVRVYLLAPLIALGLVFFYLTSQKASLAPLENYKVFHFLYGPGLAKEVRTSYLKDITDVYLPWKIYLSQGKPNSCKSLVEVRGRKVSIDGITLPDGKCYPLDGVRSNISVDALWILDDWLSFFPAYDLSYLLLLAAIYLSALIFFGGVIGRLGTGAGFFAALFAFSFPLARELQFDGLSQCWPFLLVSVFALHRSFSEEKVRILWLGLSSLLLLVGIWRSTLQGMGMWLLLWAAFAILIIWLHRGSEKKRALLLLLGSIVPVGIISVWMNFPALAVFFSDANRFLPEQSMGAMEVALRRLAALMFSWGNFFYGDLLNGFNTIDLSKSIRPLGGRESFSYDGNAFFTLPFLALFFACCVASEIKKGFSHSLPLKILTAAVVFDILISLSPAYRILYLRFHQWWCLLIVLWFCAYRWRDRPLIKGKHLFIFSASVFLSLQMVAFFLDWNRDWFLARVGREGVLGFEPGVWEARLDAWISRARVMDYYSSVYWFSLIVMWVLYRYRMNRALFLSVCVFSMGLNTFHLNFPQNQKLLGQLLEKLKAEEPSFSVPAGFPGPIHKQNLWLMVGKTPRNIHESLSIVLKE
jgi:hypothetical protein